MKMPKRNKKAKIVENDLFASDEDFEDEDIIDETVNVDFDAFPADDSDYHGIKGLLSQLFKGLDIDVGALADIIISQNYVGSVVKQVDGEEGDDEEEEDNAMDDDQDEVFGVTSVVNLTKRKDEPAIASLRTTLMRKCKANASESTNALVENALEDEDSHIGLLISERLVNLPPAFAVPIFDSLVNELSEAKTSGKAFNFTYLVMVCKIFRNQKSKKKKKEKAAEILWSNAEEEVFNEECIACFDYAIADESDIAGGVSEIGESGAKLLPHRRVLVFEAKELPNIITKAKQAIG